MPVTYQINTSVRTNNGSVSVPAVSISGDAELVYDDLIPASAVNHQILLALDVSEIQALVIAATGLASGKTITLKTNSTSSPANTLSLTAAAPGVVWYTGSAAANPLTVDTTSVYASNDDTVARRLQIYVCADITP